MYSCENAASSVSSSEPKIIAIGDMHGDFAACESLMLDARLMNTDGDWVGGTTTFIQTGDIPDRGPDTRLIIESLQKLEKQARDAGGRIIPLVGNHEAMMMNGRLKYVHPAEFTAFVDENSHSIQNEKYKYLEKEWIQELEKTEARDVNKLEAARMWYGENPLGKIEHQEAWSPTGEIGTWVAENRVVYKLNGYLFAHGGFSKEYSIFSLEEMNIAGHKALLAQDFSSDNILGDSYGPLWYRGLVRGREDNALSREEELNLILETYDASHVIVGHTISKDGIVASLGGRLIQIDTGASAYYSGIPSYLRIENGEFFAHTLDGFTKL